MQAMNFLRFLSFFFFVKKQYSFLVFPFWSRSCFDGLGVVRIRRGEGHNDDIHINF